MKIFRNSRNANSYYTIFLKIMEILNWNLEIQWQRYRKTQVERTTNNNNGSF
jgi:hypothetical protein